MRTILCAAAAGFVTAGAILSQVITTVAGANWSFPQGVLPAISAPDSGLPYVAIDTARNIYIADSDSNQVMQVSPTGTLVVVAGNGTKGYSGDNGLAINAALSYITGLAADASGNLYIADGDYNVIRKVSKGVIT